jgi:hypothetical protein
MTIGISEALKQLQQQGWNVEKREQPKEVNAEVFRRYNWMPSDVLQFISETKSVISPENKAWFQTSDNFNNTTDSAFKWNQWELLSLDCAQKERDGAWATSIKSFWDTHFPIFMSVKSGYGYFAVEKSTLKIVQGFEPEFEETLPLADNFLDLLEKLMRRDPSLRSWVWL